MSSTNRGGERIALDAYYTPDTVARACIGTIQGLLRARCWEPHAGGGAFVRALIHRGAMVTASDINPDAAGIADSGLSASFVGDFLAYPATDDNRPEWIFGNTPFTEAERHVRHALAHATVGVGFLLRLAFLETQARAPFWREHPCAEVYVLTARPSFTDGATDSCAYGWFIWRKGHIGPTILRHLNWKS